MTDQNPAPAEAGMFDYDAELSRYHQRLRMVIDIGPSDHVLDIGCGSGQTTREAGRAAVSGSALGVDLSAPRLAEARRLTAAEGPHNVSFELADAQVHPFPPAHFTLAISRLGTMFFADPVAAFTNIARALRPGAPLIQLVWQHRHRQEWDTAIRDALGDRSTPPAAGPGDPFSLASPATVETILGKAGFTGVQFSDVHESVYYGPDARAARNVVLRLQVARDLLAEHDATQTKQALDRLHTILTEHDTGDGVWFDSRAWIITARRDSEG
jgi:SAM-dependent methyltransferase